MTTYSDNDGGNGLTDSDTVDTKPKLLKSDLIDTKPAIKSDNMDANTVTDSEKVKIKSNLNPCDVVAAHTVPDSDTVEKQPVISIRKLGNIVPDSDTVEKKPVISIRKLANTVPDSDTVEKKPVISIRKLANPVPDHMVELPPDILTSVCLVPNTAIHSDTVEIQPDIPFSDTVEIKPEDVESYDTQIGVSTYNLDDYLQFEAQSAHDVVISQYYTRSKKGHPGHIMYGGYSSDSDGGRTVKLEYKTDDEDIEPLPKRRPGESRMYDHKYHYQHRWYTITPNDPYGASTSRASEPEPIVVSDSDDPDEATKEREDKKRIIAQYLKAKQDGASTSRAPVPSLEVSDSDEETTKKRKKKLSKKRRVKVQDLPSTSRAPVLPILVTDSDDTPDENENKKTKHTETGQATGVSMEKEDKVQDGASTSRGTAPQSEEHQATGSKEGKKDEAGAHTEGGAFKIKKGFTERFLGSMPEGGSSSK